MSSLVGVAPAPDLRTLYCRPLGKVTIPSVFLVFSEEISCSDRSWLLLGLEKVDASDCTKVSALRTSAFALAEAILNTSDQAVNIQDHPVGQKAGADLQSNGVAVGRAADRFLLAAGKSLLGG